MNHLLRTQAPVTEVGWEQLDEEARQRLVPSLAARKLVEFSGPLGWQHSATNVGRAAAVDPPGEGLSARRRSVLALVELRADFSVARSELLDAERGAKDLDLAELDQAASRIARAENVAVFHGWPAADMKGITEATPHDVQSLGTDYVDYPARVARAVQVLRTAGIAGPYGLALGPEGYTGVVETTEHGGITVFDHLRQVLEGPIVWAPGVAGAVVVSLRGGDFLFESGQDLSIGFSHADAERVHLYIEESFSFTVASADAAVALDG